MNLSGIMAVAGQEFTVRLRTGRWRWVLGVWFVVLTAFAVLLKVALPLVGVRGEQGIPVFGGLMLWVLGLALLITPALSAQAINGDRDRGTLATLQVTRLTAVEIAAGKLISAWGTLAVFLALTLPHVLWAIVLGGVGPGRALVVLAVVLLLCGVICAVALALSALLARGITSAVLSYIVVFALTIGTAVAFGLGMALTTETVQKTVRVPKPATTHGGGVGTRDGVATLSPNGERETETYTYTSREPHPERVWWLLAPNPFVILADSAPRLQPRRNPVTGEPQLQAVDPLGILGRAVRTARVTDSDGTLRSSGEFGTRGKPVWPYGLAFDLLLGAGAFVVTVRKLRTPVHRLPRGIRIA